MKPVYMQSSDPHSYAVSDNNSKAILPIIAAIIHIIIYCLHMKDRVCICVRARTRMCVFCVCVCVCVCVLCACVCVQEYI